jgi:hypothetical protein
MIRISFRTLLILTSLFVTSLHAVALEHNSNIRGVALSSTRNPLLYPWVELAELTTTDTNAFVGAAMAVAGNTVAASGDFQATGAVYVYVKPASGWTNGTQVAKLTSSTGLSLGYSVAISPDANTIVAGDPSTGADNNGAVYVFVKPAGGWKDMTETAKLTISGMPKAIALGTSVGISGNTIVAGAAGFGSGTEGAAYVFVKPAGGWKNATQNATLTPSNRASNDGFGYSISISGNTVAVGSIQVDAGPGAVYVFVKSASGWKNTQEAAELTASDGVENDDLGAALSITGETIAAGAPGHGAGAAYVFVKPASGWVNATQNAELSSSHTSNPEALGKSLSMSGNTIVAGADYMNDEAGRAFVFVQPAGGWTNMTETSMLRAPQVQIKEYFGESVAISQNTIAVGAPGDDPAGVGAVYIFGK